MKKFLAAAAMMLVAAFAIQAAPTLGVEWRAAVKPKGGPGVKIMSVDAGSNAEELGLQEGDVVLTINGKLVSKGAEATAAVKAANGVLSLVVIDVNTGKAVEISAEIDEPTKGLVAGAPGKAGYKNIVRKRK